MQATHWPFYAVLLVGYLAFVYVLARESWSGLRHGRTGIYWRAGLLKTRKVDYDRAETPWRFGFALAANLGLLIAAAALPLLFLGRLL